MIDLHLHLDGSLTPKMIIKLAKLQNIILPTQDEDELLSLLSVSNDCESLNDYLKCFDLPLQLLQTPQAVYQATLMLCEELKKEGLLYCEIRFAPQLHTKLGHSQGEIVRAAIDGMKKSGLNSNLILCCMRMEDNLSENLKTVDLAHKYLGSGVVCIDLAGAEGLYANENFVQIFERAKAFGLPFIIHAGEADGASSVESAVKMGASRIGHGIRAKDDESVMLLLKDKGIPLELCPTSNLQTRAVDDISNYPLRLFLEKGIKVCINTDNRVVSNTNISKEFDLVIKEFNLSFKEQKELILNGIDAAFLSDSQKTRLREKLEERLKN